MTTITEEENKTLLFAIGRHLSSIEPIKEAVDKTRGYSIDANISLKSQQEKIDTLDQRLKNIEQDLKALPRIEGMLRKLTMTEEEIKQEEYLDTPLNQYFEENGEFGLHNVTLWWCHDLEQNFFHTKTIRCLLDRYSILMENGGLFNSLKKDYHGIGAKKAAIIVKDFKKMAKKAGRACN
jgi:hypothetical protein